MLEPYYIYVNTVLKYVNLNLLETSESVQILLYLSLYRNEFQVYNSWLGDIYSNMINPRQMLLCKRKTV